MQFKIIQFLVRSNQNSVVLIAVLAIRCGYNSRILLRMTGSCLTT